MRRRSGPALRCSGGGWCHGPEGRSSLSSRSPPYLFCHTERRCTRRRSEPRGAFPNGRRVWGSGIARTTCSTFFRSTPGAGSSRCSFRCGRRRSPSRSPTRPSASASASAPPVHQLSRRTQPGAAAAASLFAADDSPAAARRAVATALPLLLPLPPRPHATTHTCAARPSLAYWLAGRFVADTSRTARSR